MKTQDAEELARMIEEIMGTHNLGIGLGHAENGGVDSYLVHSGGTVVFRGNQSGFLSATRAAWTWARHSYDPAEFDKLVEKAVETPTVRVDHLPGMPVQLRRLNQDAVVREISVLGAEPNHVIQYRVTYWANNEQKSEWVYPDQLKP